MIDFAIQAERNDWDDEQVAMWMDRRIDPVDGATILRITLLRPLSPGRSRGGSGSVSQKRCTMRGNGRIFQRPNSSSIWISYYHRGREVRESIDKHLRVSGVTRPATANDAEKLLKLRLKDIGAEQLGLKPFVGPSQDNVLVGELLDAA
jgi:hypothetical protein